MMWKWIVQLWKRLVNDPLEERRAEDVLPRVKPRQLQARSKNIYPRERLRRKQAADREREPARRPQFRFPVIPDQPKKLSRRAEAGDPPAPYEMYAESAKQRGQAESPHTKEDRKQPSKPNAAVHAKQRETSEPRSGHDPEQRVRTREAAPAAEQENRPFQATEIISPVFGRLDPNRRYDREMLSRPLRQNNADPPAKEAEQPMTQGMVTVEEETRPAVTSARMEREPSPASIKKESRTDEEPMAANGGDTPSEDRQDHSGLAGAEAVDFIDADHDADHSEWDRAKAAEDDPVGTEGMTKGETDGAPSADSEESYAAEQAEETPLVSPRRPEYDQRNGREAAEEAVRAAEHPPYLIGPERPAGHPVAYQLPQAADPEPSGLAGGETLSVGGREGYLYPPLHLLAQPPQADLADEESTAEQKRLLEETLENFHVQAQVVGIVKGPTVTRFEVQPAPGVKVNKITSLSDDIKLSLSAKDIRIEAPIPGRNAVGIEVPNRSSQPVFIRQIIESDAFQAHPSPLAVALGMDIGGEAIVADIKKMPHGLIAGATGSGKSVCINSIIVSLLYKASPEQVRLLLIDPKMVELAPYNHLPHLVTPVVTDAKQATAALKWAVEEMERRYALFVDAGARDIERYNRVAEESLPYIVIIIDELADLMMVSPQDVEDAIIRIAQKARACGIHLLLATQRPSVDVITGNIKANVPTRLAFAVFSQIDSRTILDQTGAERLLGRGDMLFLESGAAPLRLQGNFVSDDEIERVTEMIKRQRKPDYLFTKEELEQSVQSYDMGEDPLYMEALVHVAEQGQASASALQRRFRIGYNRAARLIEMMEADGYVSGQSGGKPRTVLISSEDAKALLEGSSLL